MRILLTGGGTAGHVLPHIAVVKALKKGINKSTHSNTSSRVIKSSQVHERKGRSPLQILYVGSRKGPERELVRDWGWDYRSIPVGKWRRYFDWRNATDPIKVAFGILKSWGIVGRFRPDVIFSKGGYVALPVVIAGWLRRVPVVIHDSDARPGLVTRISAPLARTICLAYPEAAERLSQRRKIQNKIVVTGTPLRPEILNGNRTRGLKWLGWKEKSGPSTRSTSSTSSTASPPSTVSTSSTVSPPSTASPGATPSTQARRPASPPTPKPIVLVMGGSLGSETVNDVVRQALPELVTHARIVHLTGRGKGSSVEGPNPARPPRSSKDRAKSPKPSNSAAPPTQYSSDCTPHSSAPSSPATPPSPQDYRAFEYVNEELADLYAVTNLVVSRAGANSLLEICALKKPSVLIPLSKAVSHGDQIQNAQKLEKAGGAVVLQEENLTPNKLIKTIRTLLKSPKKMEKMGRNAAGTVQLNAAETLAEALSVFIHSNATSKR